jgi:hypothetical protein
VSEPVTTVRGRPHYRRRRRSGPIYVAASLSIADTDHYREGLAWLKLRYSQYGVIEGPIEFSNTRDWKDRWLEVRAKVSRLIVIPDPGGVIGAGTYYEILDAVFKHIPVRILAAGGQLIDVHSVALTFLRPATPTRFAVIDYWESV